MVLSLRAFQQSGGNTLSSASRGMNSGHISVDDTELINRQTKSATPAPMGIFSIPHLGKFGGNNKSNGAGNKNNQLRSSDNAVEGVAISIDVLEKSDGAMMDSNASGRRNRNNADPEKGMMGKTPSLYSHEERVS